MRIKSVSQLSNINSSSLASLPMGIDWFINNECYIETSLSASSMEDGTTLYDSYKLSFSDYCQQISAEITKIYDYINEKVKALSNYIDELSGSLTERLDEQDSVISNFISSMNDNYVHKVKTYTYTLNGNTISTNFEIEYIEGTKIFEDNVVISGENSLLSASQVIEGTARRALWS